MRLQSSGYNNNNNNNNNKSLIPIVNKRRLQSCVQYMYVTSR